MLLAKLADLKAALNIPAAETAQDALLTRALTAAGGLLDQHLQRTLLTDGSAVTEVYHGGRRDVLLKRWPVVTVSSVKEALDWDFDASDALTELTDYYLSTTRGVLTRLPLGATWPDYPESVQIVYAAGYIDPVESVLPAGFAYVPDHVQSACLYQAAELYRRRDEPGYKVVVGMHGGMTDGTAPQVELLDIVKQLVAGERR